VPARAVGGNEVTPGSQGVGGIGTDSARNERERSGGLAEGSRAETGAGNGEGGGNGDVTVAAFNCDKVEAKSEERQQLS